MKFIALILLIAVRDQSDVPMKPFEEFELKLDFTFRTRPVDSNTMDFDESKARPSNQHGKLPFVMMNLRFLELTDDEVRVRLVNSEGRNLLTKKVDLDLRIKFDLGYAADLKDHIGDHEFSILLLNGKRDPVSRIHLYVTEDGTFLVNDETRGKF